ncbi:septum site-determining protein MinC [Bacillota bacterium LX-D]|nr:septum site-determining protein MinC [Bacillota bacterium LX-D]
MTQTKSVQVKNYIPAEDETILIQRTIRSGQVIRYPGNVVVMGDVNPGAEIVAGGNIVIMGHLRGVVHAGAFGNEQAVVAAFKLQPTQLRIANHITRAPDEEELPPQQPEIAKIKNEVVVIEQFHPWIKHA